MPAKCAMIMSDTGSWIAKDEKNFGDKRAGQLKSRAR
jgi:hypothetical protein